MTELQTIFERKLSCQGCATKEPVLNKIITFQSCELRRIGEDHCVSLRVDHKLTGTLSGYIIWRTDEIVVSLLGSGRTRARS